MSKRFIFPCTILLSCLLLTKVSSADSITGTVFNQTSGKPSMGDEVVLLRLGEGMQEQGHTRTDPQGSFTLPAPVATAEYVVRVFHQGVNYDRTATAGSPLQITVYDSVSRIPGLMGNIGMVQMESSGNDLKVTEMYAIRNASDPPVTQSNPRNFTISLPDNASMDSTEVKSGSGMWTKAPLAQTPGQNNQYSVKFPIRPGDTLFKFVYHLPYRGDAAFHLKLAYPIQKFAILHPPSMSFQALRAGTFVAPGLANGLKVEKAVSEPLSGEVPGFVISGTGNSAAVPRAMVVAPATPQAPAPLEPKRADALSKTNEPEKASNTAWLEIAVGLAVLALTGTIIWRVTGVKRASKTPSASTPPLLEALKEELFQLESERVRGAISHEEYTATKHALNLGIQRALARKE